METKLILRMDDKIINAAKILARKQGASLSKLVADYLQMMTSKSASASAFKPTPILAEITGVLQQSSGRIRLARGVSPLSRGKVFVNFVFELKACFFRENYVACF